MEHAHEAPGNYNYDFHTEYLLDVPLVADEPLTPLYLHLLICVYIFVC